MLISDEYDVYYIKNGCSLCSLLIFENEGEKEIVRRRVSVKERGRGRVTD